MEPVWRSKEKEYTLYLGARDRQSTRVQLPFTASAMLYCLGHILCFFFVCSVYCNKWPYLVLSSPPSQCLPTCCMAGGMLALWHRLGMASACRGSLQLGLLAHSSSIALGNLRYPADLASGSWFTVLEAYVHRTVSCWGLLQNSYSCPLSFVL